MVAGYKEDHMEIYQLIICKSIKNLTCFVVGLSIVFSCISTNAFAKKQASKLGENVLTVDNGSGDGRYTTGSSIIIKAAPAPSGQVFDRWVMISGKPSISNASSTTFLTMPPSAVTVMATYKNMQPITSALTAKKSIGDGSYTSGSSTIIKTKTAPSGQESNSGNSSIAVVKKEKKSVPKTEKVHAKSNINKKTIARAKSKTGAKRKKQERAKRERPRYQIKTSTPNGRNMKRMKASVGLRHSFLDRKTVLTNRLDGTTTEPESETITTGDSYSTKMHNDSVRLRFGLTDAIEAFVDAGLAYDQLSNISDMKPVFGGGGRVNIAAFDKGFLSGLYLAISCEYLQGKLIKNDSSVDWQDMTATLESGIVFSKMSFFAGCSYMMYSESITTKQIQIEDELEQQGSINFSGGIEYNYLPSMNFLLEIQAPNRQGGIMSVEYRF